jgi:hypothetical protein
VKKFFLKIESVLVGRKLRGIRRALSTFINFFEYFSEFIPLRGKKASFLSPEYPGYLEHFELNFIERI